MNVEKRISKELANEKATPIPGITAGLKNANNLFHWHAEIAGPEGSPYEGGSFELDIRLPSKYPMEPPMVKFKTSIFHPNVDDQGSICLDILKGQWSPALNVQKVLLSVSSLLTDPNFDDPLNGSATMLFKKDRNAYDKKCREFTRLHAMSASQRQEFAAQQGTKRKASTALDSAPDSSAPNAKAKAKSKAKAKAKASRVRS
mmetsp:Transcript_33681/g.53560  ORF Transcript_33681/g.53560 Transcript_33681/m.53560 type:complete len:202 (+) Transcript_33681:55-660(+)